MEMPAFVFVVSQSQSEFVDVSSSLLLWDCERRLQNCCLHYVVTSLAAVAEDVLVAVVSPPFIEGDD